MYCLWPNFNYTILELQTNSKRKIVLLPEISDYHALSKNGYFGDKEMICLWI